MIRIRPELFATLKKGGIGPVLDSLQIALDLEHATIPLYLYALFSLDRTKNSDIRQRIRSVVEEEMLHMTLVCNIINALGGTPRIDDPDHVPKYDGGPLPGGVESDLAVHLAAYSPDQLATFLKIEQPEKPLKFPTVAFAAAPLTIGEFYREIKRQLSLLDPGSFSKVPKNQIGPADVFQFSQLIEVTDFPSASAAIDIIIEQGEGTLASPKGETESDFAHYYRFSEIYYGRKLRKNPAAGPTTPPDEQYIYDGDPVTFDSSGVFRVPTDPKAANYPAGSDSRKAMDLFNYTYTRMLKLLQEGFSGKPAQLQTAIEVMTDELRPQGRDMTAGKAVPGVSLGPSFEYQPTAPT
jgi:bacterioferritin (cytochrome b1)